MDNKEILKIINDITLNDDVQRKIYAQGELNRQFIKGNQWVYLDGKLNVQDVERDREYFKRHRRHKPREVVNIIAPIWQTFKAHLLNTMPKIIAKPQSLDDIDDVLAAKVATKIMEYFYETLIVEGKQEEIINYVIEYGTAILHPYYNKKTKQIELYVIPPTQIFVYPANENKWENVKGICWKRAVLVDEVKSEYPHLELTSEPIPDYLESKDRKAEGKITCYDYWHLPNAKNDGYMVRVFNNEIVFNSKVYPAGYNDKMGKPALPFFPVFDRKVSNELFGFTTIGLLIERQKSLNKSKSLLSHMRSILPKLKLDVTTKIDPEAIIDDDATIIEYQGMQGKEPGYIGQPIPSPALFEDIKTIPQEIEHTSGLHEIILRGVAPGSIQSGAGIERLQLGDELRLIPCLKSLRKGLIDTFTLFYSLCREYYTTKQIKQILGEMGEIDIITFDEVPVLPMTFSIASSSFSPFDQSIKQQKILQILPFQLLNLQDPKVRIKVLRWFDQDLADSIDTTGNEERRARWENRQMLQGIKMPVLSDDVDDVHIDTHNLIRKDIRFNRLDERVQQLFEEHIKQHQVQGLKKLQQTMQIMNQTQPSSSLPPQSPSPSPDQTPSTPSPLEENQIGGINAESKLDVRRGI